MKRTLILFLVLFTSLLARAQELRIAKENILCLYGLKNAAGTWVFEPRFTALTVINNGTFRTFDGVKYGLLDATGKEVVEPKYDELNWLNNGYYEVKNNRKIGFLLQNFQEVIPVEYVFATYLSDPNEILLHKKINDTVYSTIVRIGSQTILPLTKGAFLPSNRNWVNSESEKPVRIFTVGDSCRFVAFSGRTITYGKLGLSDETGKVLVPKMYDEIQYRDGQSCWVIKDRKLGAIKLDGRVIIEPEYYYDYSNSYENRLYISGNTSALIPILGSTNRFGRMDFNGKIVIAPEYDEIGKNNYPIPSSILMLKKSGKVGFANEKGKIICEVVYDTLIPIAYVNPTANARTQSIDQIWFVFRKEGCYGVMNTAGEIVLPADYKTYTRHWYKNRQVGIFTKDELVLQLEFGKTEVKAIPMKLVNKESSIFLFTADSILVPFYKPVNQSDLRLHERFSYEGQFLKVQLENLHYGAQLTFNSQGKLILPREIFSSVMLDANHFLVRTFTSRAGVFNVSTQTWIMDTLYASIERDVSSMYYWAVPYRASHTGVQLYNQEGKRLTAETFDGKFIVGDTVIISSNGKCGMISPKLEWIISPVYSSLVSFGEKKWLANSITNKTGIIDVHNKLLVDTVYSLALPVFCYGFNPHWDYSNTTIPIEEWWLLANATDTLLLNDKGLKWSVSQDSKKYYSLLDELALRGYCNEAYGAFTLRMSDERYLKSSHLDSVFRATEYWRTVLSDYRSEYFKNNPCGYVYKITNAYSDCGRVLRTYKLMGVGKRFYSIETKWYEERYSMEMPLSPELFAVYDNVVYTNGALRSIELKEIFGSETVLRRELENAVRLAENLNSSCGDPDKLLDKIKGFYLTSEGVNIIYEYLESEPLIIPVSRLNKVPESKWIVPYLQ